MDSTVLNYAAPLLVRYLTNNSISVEADLTHLRADRESHPLLTLWARSSCVYRVSKQRFLHRELITPSREFELQQNDAVIRGVIDHVATHRNVILKQNPAHVSSFDPTRRKIGPLDKLVAMVIQTAYSYSTTTWPQFNYERKGTDPTEGNRLQALEKAHEVSVGLIGELPLSPVPNVEARTVQNAGMAPHALYRHAADAYRCWMRVRALETRTLAALLKDSLLGPSTPAVTFELATACAIGKAFESVTQQPADFVLRGADRPPLVRCGQYEIYWQPQGSFALGMKLTESEQRVRAIMSAYGRDRGNRPDLVVVDQADSAKIVSVIECKYSAKRVSSSRVYDGVSQLERYCRDYSGTGSDAATLTEHLLARSLVIVRQDPGFRLKKKRPAYSPLVVKFDPTDQLDRRLRGWAARVHGGS